MGAVVRLQLGDGRAQNAQCATTAVAESVQATATLAAVQGGLVLTQATGDPQHLATAADAAYDHLRAHASNRRVGRYQPAISFVARVER